MLVELNWLFVIQKIIAIHFKVTAQLHVLVIIHPTAHAGKIMFTVHPVNGALHLIKMLESALRLQLANLVKIIVSVVEIKLFATIPYIALILLALMGIAKEFALHYTKQIAGVELITHFA